MGVAIGSSTHVAVGMQTAFGTPAVPAITHAPLRSGSSITPRQGRMPRISTARVMPGNDQTWNTIKLVDAQYDFEFTSAVSAWLPWFRSAWGHELLAAGPPATHTYNILNPPVESGTDTATDFYNHALTLRHTFAAGSTDVKTYEIRDFCINEFTMSCNANETLQVGFSGTGQNFQAATMVAFSEPTGTTYSWEHLIASANGGIYAGSANPPTTAMPLLNWKFTLTNNLRFQPFLGNATGLELKLPSRTAFPTMTVDVSSDFDDISSTDAVSLMTDFIAATSENLKIKAYIDANSSVQLLFSAASNRPAIIAEPTFPMNGEGVVGFGAKFNILPATVATDATMLLVTAS